MEDSSDPSPFLTGADAAGLGPNAQAPMVTQLNSKELPGRTARAARSDDGPLPVGIEVRRHRAVVSNGVPPAAPWLLPA